MKLVIVQPTIGAVSETFLRIHAERLPADVTIVHGSNPSIDGKPVLAPGTVARGLRKLDRIARGRDNVYEVTRAYLAAFRQLQPDAVLAEYGVMGSAVCDACEQAGVPLVVHFHGYDASRKDILEKYEQRYRKMFSIASAIVGVSRAMCQRLIDLGAPEDRVHYNPCGVDCEQFQGGDPGHAEPRFLTVGRFVEKKAPYLSVLAFSQALEKAGDKLSGAELRMIGDGDLLGVCKDLAKGLGIADRVAFLGAQPSEVVQREMRQARAFLQHSVEATSGDCEGTPVAVLEAGATGVPVISTRHAGIPDVVIDGETGLLTDERDVSATADHIIELATHADRAATLGAAAQKHIAVNHTVEKSIGTLWSVIDASVNATPQARSA